MPIPFQLIALATVILCAGADARAQTRKDAAETVQEGSVANWMEYYRKERIAPAGPPQPAPPAQPTQPTGGAAGGTGSTTPR